MSLARQLVKLGDPGLLFSPVAIAAKRLGQFISPTGRGRRGRMDALNAGDLSQGFSD